MNTKPYSALPTQPNSAISVTTFIFQNRGSQFGPECIDALLSDIPSVLEIDMPILVCPLG